MRVSKLKRCPFCKRDTARFAVNPRPKGPYGKGVELDFGVCCDKCNVFMTTHENVYPSRIINKTTHAYDFSDTELRNKASPRGTAARGKEMENDRTQIKELFEVQTHERLQIVS